MVGNKVIKTSTNKQELEDLIKIYNTYDDENYYHIEEKEVLKNNGDIDLHCNQNLLSIRKDGEVLGYIEAKEGKIVTNGAIGENSYNNFVELIKGLWGHGISIDNFYS